MIAEWSYAIRRLPMLWPFNTGGKRQWPPLIVWIDPQWWSYLLSDLRGLPWWSEPGDRSRTRRFVCRALGHPSGVHYFTAYGLEPDMRCQNCEEYLG